MGILLLQGALQVPARSIPSQCLCRATIGVTV